VSTYRRLLREAAGVSPSQLAHVGRRVAEQLDACPWLVEEIEGIAKGAGQDPCELLAVNARTELLGPMQEGECSLVAWTRGDDVGLAQNWDWHPALASAAVVITTTRDDGSWFTTLTEAGIVAKLGLNSSGLAVGLNFLTCSEDGGLDGLPVHVLLRRLLEECTDSLSALELLLGARVSASAAVTVAAAEEAGSAVFTAELSPAGPAIAWLEDEWLVHTNHFLVGPAGGVDTQPSLFPSTLLRREHLLRRIRHGAAVPEVLAEHFPRGQAICRHDGPVGPWAEERETLASVMMDLRPPALRVAAGPPCRTPYAPVALPT